MAFLIVAAGAATADQVWVGRGGMIEGIARDQGDKVIVEVPYGIITLDRGQVGRIVPGRTVMHEYRERLASLEGSQNPEALYETAEWAREHGITLHVDNLLKRTIAAAPDHRGARRWLGYVEVDGRWMTQPEILAAKGMVFEDGRWVSARERERSRAEEREQLRIRRERRAAYNRALDKAEAYPYPFSLPSYIWPSGSRTAGNSSYGASYNLDPYSHRIHYTIPLTASGMGTY